MNQKKRLARWAAGGLAVLSLTGVVWAANGDKNDPLVTLSYLNDTVIPKIVSQVEKKMAARQTELDQSLQAQIARYQQSTAGTGGGTSASYALITLSQGQTLSLDVGCELLLRVGTAKVNANTDPALIDLSTGGTLGPGGSLTKNHLYMATIPDRTLSATAGTVKLLVRGGYSVT